MITTSPARMKKGLHWCEDADRITADVLHGSEYTLESEIPFGWILDHAGLSNSLLALGAMRPRYQVQANGMLLNYCKRLYGHVRDQLIDEGSPPIVDVHHWIGNPDRAQACKVEAQVWRQWKESYDDPYTVKLFSVMELLFSEQPLVLKAIHGTKFYLGAMAMKFGFGEADIIKQNLTEYLRKQLGNEK